MNEVAPYLEFAKKAFARESTYRFEVLTEIGSVLIRVYIMRSLWTALYAQNAAPDNIPLPAMITYSTVALLMSLILEVDGTRMIRTRLREGTIATDFMKPISVPAYFFADGLGQTAFHALLIVPALCFALLFVHIQVPPLGACVAFVPAFALGYLVNFFLNFIMNSIAFWTLETFSIQLMVRWASDLLSGLVLPLTFFPGVAGRIVAALPFASIYWTPLRIYIGELPPSGYGEALATQALWVLAFAALGAVIWRAGSRRIVIQGG
jgi:ABC-2 type transport system permease protein